MEVLLDATHVVDLARTLRNRIHERFPDVTLLKTAGRIVDVAESTARRARWIARPNVLLRLVTTLLVLAIPASMLVAFWILGGDSGGEKLDLAGFVTFFQSSVESLIFLGLGIAFLVTLETRLKRRRALTAVHELRVLAHLVDLHQLDKDPVYIHSPGPTTKSSPKRTLTAFELNRYLDYCSEMLSLLGKIAALYGRDLHDPAALAAVDQVEALTTGLSRKIWQKVMLLDRASRAS